MATRKPKFPKADPVPDPIVAAAGKKPSATPKASVRLVAGKDHNAADEAKLSNEQGGALFFQAIGQYSKFLAAKKKADADFKNACKQIKTDLGEYGVEQVKLGIKLREDGGKEELEAQHARNAQVAMWLGLPIGTQGDFFKADRRPRDEVAYADGFADGAAGETMNATTFGGFETKNGQRYVDGWHAGQASINKIKELQGAPIFRENLAIIPDAEGVDVGHQTMGAAHDFGDEAIEPAPNTADEEEPF